VANRFAAVATTIDNANDLSSVFGYQKDRVLRRSEVSQKSSLFFNRTRELAGGELDV